MTTTDHQNLSPVMTSPEVAKFLRLIDDTTATDDIAKARRVVDRLRLEGRLRGVKPSKEFVYPRAEVQAFLVREIESQPLGTAEVAS